MMNESSSLVFSPKAGFWQELEPSQATGMALAHCILGSFLGVGCHCFPPLLDVPTFACRCLHVQATWETSISERRNYGREMAGQFCLWFQLPRKPRVLWHAAQICWYISKQLTIPSQRGSYFINSNSVWFLHANHYIVIDFWYTPVHDFLHFGEIFKQEGI